MGGTTQPNQGGIDWPTPLGLTMLHSTTGVHNIISMDGFDLEFVIAGDELIAFGQVGQVTHQLIEHWIKARLSKN